MNQNEPKRSNATHNLQQRFTTNFPYHVHKLSLRISLLMEQAFIYLGISKMSFNFHKSSRQCTNKGSQKGQYLTTRTLLEAAGSHVSKFLSLSLSGTKRDVAPKQRYDKFPFIGDQIYATPTFEQAWASPGHTVIGGSQKSKEQYRLVKVYGHSSCNI